jgi:viologen exporter family transport system permease protein
MLAITHRFGRAWWVALRLTALNFRAQLEYRAEFIFNVAIGAVWQISVIVFATVLLTRFPGMGGWASSEVLLIASMRLLGHGLQVLVLGRVTWMPMFVHMGLIDAYLLRPMPVYRQVQLAFFPTNAIGDLGVAIILFAGALSLVDVTWTPGLLGYLLAGIIGGMLMEAAILTAMGAVAMHAPATMHWSVWVEDLFATFGNYPLSILPRFVAELLTFVLPIAFIAYLPAAVITGHLDSVGVPAWLAAGAPLVGLLAYLASRRLWLVSLRRYEGQGAS